MGLDFSHCDARWSYSGFARFRNRLAEVVNILDYNEISDTNDDRLTKIKNDPLYFILAHSDCDGFLTAKQCRALIPRLKEITLPWGVDDYDRRQVLELIEGMKDVIKKRSRLKFM